MSDRKAIILAVLLAMAVGTLANAALQWLNDLAAISVRSPDTNQLGTLDPILNHTNNAS